MTVDTGHNLVIFLDEKYREDPNILDRIIAITYNFILKVNFKNEDIEFIKDFLIKTFDFNDNDVSFLIYSCLNQEYYGHLIAISPEHLQVFFNDFYNLLSNRLNNYDK